MAMVYTVHVIMNKYVGYFESSASMYCRGNYKS